MIFNYRLDEEGRYQLTHRVGAGTTITLTEPFKLTLDPAALAEL
ncbi:hypothetical protein [Planotetraspora sp. GP83]